MMSWMTSPRCAECGELDTEDDCACCRDCDKSPCECVCPDCGELVNDMCECDTDE